ncbi:MAG TPA: hypothetical protein VFA66_07105 [Gaiellaceae bacterium]|nr:hypothetical protein [Gaiellaceae bacterium]
MAWFLIVVLALVVIAALAVVLFLAALVSDEAEAERARIEREVRSAERRLHDIARSSFEAMLEEARRSEGSVD